MDGKRTAGTAAVEADVSQAGAGAVLDALDPEQRAVALAVRGPVCVLAGAGTGKTRAITHRIAYAALTGVVDPARVLALTFTVRAAGELRGRLRLLSGAGLGTEAVRATTFHAAALRQLTYFWPRVVGGRPPRLIESKLPLLGDAARVLRLRTEGGGLSDIAAEIEWAKVTQVRPDEYVAAAAKAGRAPGPVGADGVASLYDTYERLRRERQLIDFESVLELTAAILADSRPAADQVRASFRYFVVDEYQDVNPLQKLLLDVWLGDRDDLCVVGDPHQMIYSFTGATHRYLTGFAAEFPDATVVRLVRDYRSTPQVVALANRLVSPPAVASTAGVPATGRPAAPAPAVPLVAQRPACPQPVLHGYEDELAEAERVAARARSLIEGGLPAREIAVLVRINAMLERFESALGAAGVPYQVRGADRFYDRPEVRQAVMLLRGALRGRAEEDPAGPLPAEVRNVLSGVGLTGAEPAGAGVSPAALGVTGGRCPARRRSVRRAPGRGAGGFRGRASGPGGARPRAGHGRGDARLNARRQGPRMGRGLPPRPGGGGHADRLRPDPRGHRRGTAAALRGGHAGQGTALPVLARRPRAGRPGGRPALPLPGGADPRSPGCVSPGATPRNPPRRPAGGTRRHTAAHRA